MLYIPARRKELLKLVREHDLSELEIEHGDQLAIAIVEMEPDVAAFATMRERGAPPARNSRLRWRRRCHRAAW